MTAEEKVYGIHPVLEVLQAERRRVEKILLASQRQGAGVQRIVALASRREIPMTSVSHAQLRRLLGHDQHQGVVAFVSPLGYHTLADVQAQLTSASGPQTLLLLDGVTDVGNFATLIRSAAAFGVGTILVPRHHSVRLTPVVVKRSAGAVERVSVVQVGNMVQALDTLKQLHCWVYGTDGRADAAVDQVVWPERVVVVLGAEGRGIRRLVRSRCDSLVHIPMHPDSDSLNVAVAGSIVLSYVWNQRMTSAETQPSA